MAKKGAREWVWMVTEDKSLPQHRIQSERNKNNHKDGKLRVRKYHPTTRQHEWYIETKKK
jgi:ribosomal protein L33